MKKLFLASDASYSLDLLIPYLPKPANELNVVLIPTAGDPYDDKIYIERTREKLRALGFSFVDFDLKGQNQTSLEKALEKVDLILVEGGNTFYLLKWVRKSGFDKILPKLLNRGKIYVGSSAGSILCCPTIKGAAKFDDPSTATGLLNYDGLNLFKSIIIPHAQKEKYTQRIKQTSKSLTDQGYSVITLNDNQAIFINDGTKQLLEFSEGLKSVDNVLE